MSKRILVTGAGGPAAVGLLNAWESRDVELFAADMDPCAAGLYLVSKERRCIVPRADSLGFVDHIVALCAQHKIDLLVPTVDAELIALSRAQSGLLRVGTTLMANPLRSLLTCLDKWTLVNVATGVVPVPESSLLTASFARKHPLGTVIVKPRRGSGGRGIEKHHSSDLHRLEQSQEQLVQAYLPGDEYSVDVLRLGPDHPVACVPRLRMKVDSGVAVAGRTVNDPELIAMATRIACHLDVRGIANVQFRRDAEGVPHLLEINPRVPGTLSLTIASGIDMPGIWLDHVLGNPVNVPINFEEIEMVRTWQDHVLPAGSIEATTARSFRKSA